MTVKSFLIILILAVITTYTSTFIDALVNNTLLGGEAGFPFKFTRATMFGNGTINYQFMFLNILFWFLIISALWKFLLNRSKKSSKK